MKLKSKLVLAASSLLVLSGVAAGTGTYAWFTANQSVSATVNNVGVESHANGLKITASATDTTNLPADTTNSTEYNKIFTSGKALTDISSEGLNFYKASFTGGTISGANKRTEAGVPLYYEVKVTFTRTNVAEPMAIYLSHLTSITNSGDPAVGANKDLAGAGRIAVLNSAKDSVLAYVAPNDAITAAYTYVSKTTAGYTTALAAPASTNNVYDNTYTADVTDATLDSGSKTASRADMGDGWLLNLTGTTASADIYVRFWLEGQDSDCDNTAKAQKIATKLVFNGLTNFKVAA